MDVFWGSLPASPVADNLTMVRLVRNEVGPPSWEQDGDVLFDAPVGNLLRYTDSGLRSATFYYYTIFVFDATVQTWLRAGSTGAITPDDSFDMGKRLYELIPAFYREMDDAIPVYGPGPLQRFLKLLGFEFDVIRTEIESLAWAWDMRRGSAQGVPYALGQFLLEPEPELGYANQRALLRAAVILYALKGSPICVRTLCSTVTGWATEIQAGANLVVDNLDAQFDGSIGRWKGTNATLAWRAGDGVINAPNGRGVLAVTATSTSNPVAMLYADDPRYSGIPVTPGVIYGTSVFARGGAIDAVTVGVQFWDSDGNALGSVVNGTPIAPHTVDWSSAPTVVATAPTDAWSMSIVVSSAGVLAGQVFYVSSVMVSVLATTGSPFPAYQPARDIRIVVQANHVNEINNPKFATDTNSWVTTVTSDVTVTGGVLTRITSDEPPPVSSGTAGQLVATSAGQGVSTACTEITLDVFYTASLWVKVVSGAGVKLVVRDVQTGEVITSSAVTASGWTDISGSLVTGLSTSQVNISLVAQGATTVRFGAVLLTQGGTDVAYFDGSIANSTADYMWEGVADASRSHLYQQRIMRSYRFRELLPRFIIGGQTATLVFASPGVTPIFTPPSITAINFQPYSELTTGAVVSASDINNGVVAFDAQHFFTGARAIKLAINATSFTWTQVPHPVMAAPVTTGGTYSFSVYVYTDSPGQTVTLTVDWLSDSRVYVSTAAGGGAQALVQGALTRITYSNVTVPGGVGLASLKLVSGTGFVNGSILWVSSMQVEAGATVNAYTPWLDLGGFGGVLGGFGGADGGFNN